MGKSAVEIIAKDKGPQLHHWQMMIEEVSQINHLEKDKRIGYLLNRIDEAKNHLDSIPKNMLEGQKNTDYYKLLKNLKIVL